MLRRRALAIWMWRWMAVSGAWNATRGVTGGALAREVVLGVVVRNGVFAIVWASHVPCVEGGRGKRAME